MLQENVCKDEHIVHELSVRNYTCDILVRKTMYITWVFSLSLLVECLGKGGEVAEQCLYNFKTKIQNEQ